MEKSEKKFNTEIKDLKEENEKVKLNLAEKEELYSSIEARLAVVVKDSKELEATKNELQQAYFKIKVIYIVYIIKI